MGFCEVHFRPYPEAHTGCVLCYQSKAKKSTTDARSQAKQESIKAKQKDTAKGSKTAIKPVSKKQAAINAALTALKKELLVDTGSCLGCFTTHDLTLSHVISRRHIQYVANPLNVVLLCCSCHHLYEHDKANFALLYPNAWHVKLERAKQLSSEQYEKLKAKAEGSL